MNKPLKEHYEADTDSGPVYRIFDYAADIEKYCAHLEQKVKSNERLAYYGDNADENIKYDLKEIMHACGDKFEFIRLCNEAQYEIDEAAFDLDQESRMNGV